ncbi:MAG: hypothetical protein HQL22_05825 [Candidatus Omnitrophica bacterium]|nr:hypothetical protein [Candidatus Omnitrophota bacterium]
MRSEKILQRSAFVPEWVWLLPVMVPLLLILISYVFQTWSWGLMDDLQLLSLPGGWWQRTQTAFNIYLSVGEFKPLFAAHSAFFYHVFARAPGAFHVFKLLEILLMLALWGRAAKLVTGERVAFWLVPAIALSFHYLYDQFFFLSTHETLGLLFAGIAVNAAIHIVQGDKGRLSIGAWSILLIAMLCSFWSKETMVAVGGACGASFVVTALMGRERRPGLLYAGVILIAGVLAYGLWLKLAVCTSYTSRYNVMNLVLLRDNLLEWAKKDLLNHFPWLVAGVWLFRKGVKSFGEDAFGYLTRWALVFGVFVYGAHLLILLPWNTGTYYAAPFGVYFGFVFAVLIARAIAGLTLRPVLLIVSAAVMLNVFVAAFALERERTYHMNTQDLWEAIRGNDRFCSAAREGKVATNAPEPGSAIPGHVNRWWGLGFKAFVWDKDFSAGKSDGFEYYVYSPRFWTMAPGAFNGWQIEFNSRFWKVYRKP